jgi:hypothetical protein
MIYETESHQLPNSGNIPDLNHWEDISSIPDERDWRREVHNLREHSFEFNIQRYVKTVLNP